MKRCISKKGIGIEIDLPENYDFLKKEAEKTLSSILKNYPKANRICKTLMNDPEVNGCWDVSNYIAVSKLHYNDHGEVHAKIVTANAVKMLSLLVKHNITPDLVAHGGGTYTLDDSFLVIVAAGLLHDIGNQIGRDNHNLYSTYIALDILKRVLVPIYKNPEMFAEVRGFILHAIHAHAVSVPDLSIEAALIGIGDGTDMTKGRGRLAFDLGGADIHTVSALAIEKVNIAKGYRKPIRINITMSNSAGIFQIEHSLAAKIKGSPLEDYVEVFATATPKGTKDKRIIYEVTVKNGKIVAREKR